MVPTKRSTSSMSKKVLAVSAAVSLLMAAACSSGSSSGGNKQHVSRTVHLALTGDVDTMLPMDSNTKDNIDVLSVIYDGLVSYDAKTMEPHNRVASKISSKDKKHWTIKIKQGLKFQNGEPVDAKAFARAWNYAAYGPHAMANNDFFERFLGYDNMQGDWEKNDETGKVKVIRKPESKKLSGLEVADDHTLKVTLDEPFASFSTILGYTGFFPVPKACVKDARAVKKCAEKPIGNGPFRVDRWNQGVKLTASKWKNYQGDAPNYDQITWKEYAGNDPWPDFESGELDIGVPPPEEWQKANNDPALKDRRVERQGASVTYLGFPLYRGKPWNNKRFRKAISMAIDRKAIIDKILPGQEKPASSWVPTSIPGGRKGTCKWCHYDPKAAKKALAKAGGWPAGKTLKLYLYKDETKQKYLKAIGDQLKRNLGIDYSVEPSGAAAQYISKLKSRKLFGISWNSWGADYPLNENYLEPVYSSGKPKKGDANFGYYNAKFEKAIRSGDKADSVADATEKYRQAEKVLADDFPTIPVSVNTDVTFYSDHVDHVVLNPFRRESINLRELKYVG